jgi:SpoVK/Ycf46/Vps4 family AAA+-type ATPase
MAGVRDEFESVLEAASKVDPDIKKRRRDYKFKSFEGDELVQKIVEFGNETAEEYIEKGVSSENVPPEVISLLKFTSNLRDTYYQTHGGPSGGLGSGPSLDGGEPSSIPECKPPLSPGDITFDDIAGQKQIKEDIRQNYIYPFTLPGLFPTKSKGIMFYGPAGTGKCLDPREKVIMFDGTMKEARKISPGDLLMGDDSTSRTVLSVCSGEDEMYRITPTRGESFVVNEPHILTLVSSCRPRVKLCAKEGRHKVLWMEGGKQRSKTFTGLDAETLNKAIRFRNSIMFKEDVIDIPLDEYLKKPKSWKALYKGYRTDVDWPEDNDLPLDPYILGMWLGDGSSHHPQITNTDSEVLDELEEKFGKMGLKMTPLKGDPITYNISKDTAITNGFTDGLRELNLQLNKHIPQRYITNSRDVRHQVLAGLIDSDGHLTTGCYEIIQKNKVLADGIVFLARSCGYYVSIKEVEKTCTNAPGGPKTGTYHRMFISGDIHNIPVRISRKKAPLRKQNKDVNRFGFTVEALGMGKYCGFTIDGNSRFLLKDFTVTHNTLLARAATAEIPGAAFFSPTPGDLKGKFVGETEKNIQMLFQCAANIIGTPIRGGSKHGVEKYRVSVIFIDEFDSIAGARGDDPHMRNSVNALLQAMDGIQSSPNVSVIAATNLPWDIDDAVLRRFSAKIFVDLPDVTAREWLIRDAISKNFLSPEEKEQKLLGNRISPPWVMRKAFDKDENQFFEEVNDSIFENIEQYGKSLCLVTTEKEVAVAGGFATLYRTGKEIVKEQKSSDVGPDFISEITDDRTEKNPDRLGISPKALDLVTRIVNGEKIDYDADDITNANREYFFGYSGSDISKIMDIAIQIASSRALTTSFFPKKITTSGGSVIYYIASTPDDAKAKYVVTEDTKIMLEATTGRKFELLKGEDLLRAVNYSLCEQDILSGIEKYPSTIKTKTYVDLLIYKYQGIPPEK